MIKRLVVAGLLVSTFSAFAAARGNHPMSGCGLGYLLLTHENHSKVAQVLGVTTNDTYGLQTFGITSGTSGCTEDGAVKLVKAVEVYAEVNFDSLRREMAVGQGEMVETFAALLGAGEARRPQLLRLFQTEYASLFPSIDTTSEEMLQQLSLKLAAHPEYLS